MLNLYELAEGLSPPTRGNRPAFVSVRIASGSIPAHAGEPVLERSPVKPCAVYPRPRGGTSLWSVYEMRTFGLSPPTRGNLLEG